MDPEQHSNSTSYQPSVGPNVVHQPGMPETEISPPTERSRLELADGFAATMDVWRLDNRDIVRVTPDSIRKDSGTGEPVLPLYVALGINGDRRQLWAQMAFAQEYGGTTIGIVYRKPRGTARLVRTEGFEYPVPQLEANQADDLIGALDSLGIKRANVFTESRGNTRVEIAAEKRPDLFQRRYHQDPVGHDGAQYVGNHMNALRIVWQGLRQGRSRHEEVDPLFNELKSRGMGADHLRHSALTRRREQKAVARTHHARFNDIAARGNYAPERGVTYAGDVGDPGIRALRLRRYIEPIQATGNGVRYVETDKRAHGIGRNRRHVRKVSRHLV